MAQDLNDRAPVALILLKEDDERASIVEILEGQGFRPIHCDTDEARARVDRYKPQLVIVPWETACEDGFDLVRSLDGADTQVVFLRQEDIESTGAFRRRVCAYLRRPFNFAEFEAVVEDIANEQPSKEPTNGESPTQLGPMVGASDAMLSLYDQIEKVAPTDATVLLVGESGTGKELAARTIHRLSPRKNQPFVPVNCGAMSAGLVESQLFGHEKGSFTGAIQQQQGYFEQAHGGTLFLDEVTEMEPEHQVKLLRVLETSMIQRVGGKQEIPVDCRILAATNRSPSEAVEAGVLREDLFYRLGVFPIMMPPLRVRDQGDLFALAERFVEELNTDEEQNKNLTREAFDKLDSHDWPGNVRELKNVIRRAFILSDSPEIEAADIDPDPFAEPTGVADTSGATARAVQESAAAKSPRADSPRADSPTADSPTADSPEDSSAEEAGVTPADDGAAEAITVAPGTPIREVERELILATLAQCGGDKQKAAKKLGISTRTLYYRLQGYESNPSGDGAAGDGASPE